jgi:uncharacterized protein (TIGR02453 family)
MMATTTPLDEHLFPPFTGFPKEGIRFLKSLRRNNNREWFQKHKTDYEEFVKFPMQCFIASLAQRMADEAPEFEFNPRRSIFRIYRDVRFSKNKAPYKTNIAASFELRGKKKGVTETPGLYIHIEPGEVFIGGGLYMPSGDQLKSIRRSIADHPERYLAVVQERTFRKLFNGIQGETLVKAPLGFPKDHPMIEHLRHKQFFVYRSLDEGICTNRRFIEIAASTYIPMLPLIRWLAEQAG